jgi:hypothetical protein
MEKSSVGRAHFRGIPKPKGVVAAELHDYPNLAHHRFSHWHATVESWLGVGRVFFSSWSFWHRHIYQRSAPENGAVSGYCQVSHSVLNFLLL